MVCVKPQGAKKLWLVQHPQLAIEDLLQNTSDGGMDEILGHSLPLGDPTCNASQLRRAMCHWLSWGFSATASLSSAVDKSWYRLEDTHPTDVCLKAGFPLRGCLYEGVPTFIQNDTVPTSDGVWEKLEAEDPDLTGRIRNLTLHLGYPEVTTISELQEKTTGTLWRRDEALRKEHAKFFESFSRKQQCMDTMGRGRFNRTKDLFEMTANPLEQKWVSEHPGFEYKSGAEATKILGGRMIHFVGTPKLARSIKG